MSRQLDLVSSEYGWTDEYILNEVPIRRLRQITAAIMERKLLADRERQLEIGWQTRALARIIVSTSMLDKDGKEVMFGEVDKISLDKDELENLQQQETIPKEPEVGSYERFTKLMSGQPFQR